MKKALRKLEMLLHSAIITGLLVVSIKMILSGLYFPGSILTGLAIAAACISLFWKKLNMSPRYARLTCYYIEAPAFLICWLHFKLGHEPMLAQAYLMAAVIFPFFGYISSIKTYKTKKRAA
jgi:hypothetical protein